MKTITRNDWLKAFGTYDIRGIVGEVLSEEAYYHIGQVFAAWVLSQSEDTRSIPKWVSVGYDARIHSPVLADALIRGLLASGLSVVELGLCATPLVYYSEYLSNESDISPIPLLTATLTVTASHNPAPYNGVKFTYQGQSLDKEQFAELKELFQKIESGLYQDVQIVGQRLRFDIVDTYIENIFRISEPSLPNIQMVVDCGNGTAGIIVKKLFERLGYKPHLLFEAPDGTFPNHHPDPCKHENMKTLSQTVVDLGADIGIAFDGDSDRLGVVDERGIVVPGDYLLLLYSQAILLKSSSNEKIAIISEVKCSQTLFDRIEAMGGRAIMSPTGHTFVKKLMREEHALLGGELSGHFFFKDTHWGFDDAFYAAIRLFEILTSARVEDPSHSFSTLLGDLPKSYLSEEIRHYCPRVEIPFILSSIKDFMETHLDFYKSEMTQMIDIDGLRINLVNGFMLVRPSNTEPCLTLRFEAPDFMTFEVWQTKTLMLIEEIQNGYGRFSNQVSRSSRR